VSKILPFLPHTPDPVAESLRRRRIALGVSQNRLAARIGTAGSYLSAHESGRPASDDFRDRWIAAVAELEQLAERASEVFEAALRDGARPMPERDLRDAGER
jgi:transcriptional regulator with XRE-family HTH domain